MRTGSRITDFLSRVVLLALVLAGVTAVFVWYFPLIQRNQVLNAEIAEQEASLRKLEAEINQMQLQLALAEGDSNTVKRLIRENLGYSLAGEHIIRFETPPQAR